MRRAIPALLTAIGCLLSPVPAFAGTFHAQWLFRDAGSNVLAIKQVTLKPIAPYGVDGATVLISGDQKVYQSDSAGSLIASNLFNGRSYRVTISGPNIQTTFTNSFDTNVTGLVNGADPAYLTAPIRDTGVTAYSQVQANALFHQVGGDSSTNANFYGTFKLLGSSTSGYVWTATNSTGAGAWVASTGGGSTLWDTGSGTIFPSGEEGSESGWTSGGGTIYPE